MRPIRAIHIILLLIAALGVLSPLFFDYQQRLGHIYTDEEIADRWQSGQTFFLMLAPCMALGAVSGAVASAVNSRKRQTRTRQEMTGEFISLAYWFVTGACLGGCVALLGMAGIGLLVAGSVLLLLLPLAFLIPVVLLMTPLAALALTPALVLWLDH